MDILFLVGRIVLGAFFLFNASQHLTKTKMLAGYAGSKGVPLPTVAAIGTGIQLLVGGAMLILGWYVWIGALVLIIFLVPVAFFMHNFWVVKDPQARMMEMVQFNKDMAIAGALLIILAYAYTTDWNPISLAP